MFRKKLARSLFRKSLAITAGLLALSSVSSAYELDTHFYATYSMARYAGIKHETASVIASAAQWPDETEILGSPLVPELGIGTKMRRLFHFPCDTIAIESGAHGATTVSQDKAAKTIEKVSKYLGAKGMQNYIDTLNTYCKTLPADEAPIAYNMLFEGLQEGNLIKAATSIHTIEDSFAHAGTPSTTGHMEFGHHPDRPFTSPDKYRRMIRSVMVAMVAIRMNLPESSIDTNFRDPNAKSPLKNYQMSVDDLASSYRDNPFVQKDYRYNMLQNPEYVRRALVYMLTKAQHTNPDGEYFIDPTFNVRQWVDSQVDVLAAIDLGNNATCSLPKDSVTIQPPYVDCRLVTLLARLMTLKDDMGTPVVDQFKAVSLVKKYPDMLKLAAPYDNQIEELISQREGISIPSKYNFITFNRDSRKNLELMVSANNQIRALRHARQLALAKPFQDFLVEQTRNDGHNGLQVVLEVAQQVSSGFIPAPLNDENREEFEYEGELRTLEAALRVRNVRQTIHELYGDYVRFIENSKVWSYPLSRDAVQNLPIWQPDVLPLPGEHERGLNGDGKIETNIKYITFNYNQIDIWIENMVRYMFPDFTEKFFPTDKCTVVGEITKSINGKLVDLKPALDVKKKNDVFTSFADLLFNPDSNGCNPKWTDKSSLNKTGRMKEKLAMFLNDFGSTHMQRDWHLDSFAKGNNLPSLFQMKRTDKTNSDFGTPLFRQFQSWGQLTSQQVAALKKDMATRFAAVAAHQSEPNPYDKGPEFKDINH